MTNKINIYTSNRNNFHCRVGFTLVEILTVVFLVGVIALPFSNMFIFGVKGTNSNAEHVIAYNLAREKIEEIKGIPFEFVKSDYTNFRDVFQDRSDYDDAYYNEDIFVKHFSDIFTTDSLQDSEKEKTHKKLHELYSEIYLKPLQLYPKGYDKYRRVVKVEEISESVSAPALKKVVVSVFIEKENRKIAELRTFVGKHK